MARPLRIQYPGAFYHVTSRGNERKDIFRSMEDREKFLGYLESATFRYGASIHVYCLMSNHYHLLLETPMGNLSEIMRHINGAYTAYFNAKRRRAGHLFQGRYKAILVEADSYAAELSRYIHLNPVRARMVKSPGDYRWSSYSAYVGIADPAPWLKTDFVLNLLTRDPQVAQKRYREFVEALLNAPGESPLKAVVASTILGGEQFVREVVEKYAEEAGGEAQNAANKELFPRPSIDEVVAEVEAGWAGPEKLARKIAIYLCHRFTGGTLRQIGVRFDLKESAVAQASRRFAGTLAENQDLAAQVATLEKSLAERSGRLGRGDLSLNSESARGGDAAGKTKDIVQNIERILDDFPDVRFCTLFGSAGKGRMTAQSDVDIALAGEQKMPVEARARLSLALSSALGREVDLVDLQDVSGLILEQALCKGRVVKNADHSLYARLLKRLWYNQADMMPYIRRILEQRSSHWLR